MRKAYVKKSFVCFVSKIHFESVNRAFYKMLVLYFLCKISFIVLKHLLISTRAKCFIWCLRLLNFFLPIFSEISPHHPVTICNNGLLLQQCYERNMEKKTIGDARSCCAEKGSRILTEAHTLTYSEDNNLIWELIAVTGCQRYFLPNGKFLYKI